MQRSPAYLRWGVVYFSTAALAYVLGSGAPEPVGTVLRFMLLASAIIMVRRTVAFLWAQGEPGGIRCTLVDAADEASPRGERP